VRSEKQKFDTISAEEQPPYSLTEASRYLLLIDTSCDTTVVRRPDDVRAALVSSAINYF
jgi:hypothetical protein